jgi:hypothetical protein
MMQIFLAPSRLRTPKPLLFGLTILILSCGSNSELLPESTSIPDAGPECAPISSFDSTWEALYDRTIKGYYPCANGACHGASDPVDLRPAVAWENLIGQRSTGSDLMLVDPGNAIGSFLWRKLSAKTYPGSVEINGSPMPPGKSTLSPDHLDAWRSWINAGASKTATDLETEALLKACTIPSYDSELLLPPDRESGVQFALPTWPLAAASEREVCFARYYDLTGTIPEEFLSNDGSLFRIGGYQISQDPQGHHLVLLNYSGPSDTDHAAFGEWSCVGGEQEARSCDPKNLISCPGGHCISQIVDGPGCIGFGPPGTATNPGTNAGLLTQIPFEERVFPAGVVSQFPVRGIQYINWHAFNLHNEEIRMNGAANLLFRSEESWRLIEIRSGTATEPVPAYTTRVQCHEWEVPQGAHIFELSPHTHRFGRHVWVETSDGRRVLESRSYSDPTRVIFDPPLVLDNPDPRNRTLTICALYNNGVDAAGNPDPTTVKRYSRQTPNALVGRCEPTHCWSGRIGAECGGPRGHEDCNSAPGVNDGLCDACTLSGGVSTEDEMLLLLGAYWIDQGSS